MIKMVIFCVIAFALTWLPFNTLLVLGDVHPDIWERQDIMYIWFITHFLAMCHTITNPLIYIWMNNRFRAGFKQAISEVCRPPRSLLVYLWYHLCCLGWCLGCSGDKYRRQMSTKMDRGPSCTRLTSLGSFHLNNNHHHQHHNQTSSNLQSTAQFNEEPVRSSRVCYSSAEASNSRSSQFVVNHSVNVTNPRTTSRFPATGSEGKLLPNSTQGLEQTIRDDDLSGSGCDNRQVYETRQMGLCPVESKQSQVSEQQKRGICKECQFKQVKGSRTADSYLNKTIKTTLSSRNSLTNRATATKRIDKTNRRDDWRFRKSTAEGIGKGENQMQNNASTIEKENPLMGFRRKRRQKDKQTHVMKIVLTTREDHPAALAARAKLLISQAGAASSPNNTPNESLPPVEGRRRRSGKARTREKSRKRKKSLRLANAANIADGAYQADELSDGSGQIARQCSKCRIKQNQQEDMNRQSSLSTATISVQTNTTSLQVSPPNSTEAQRQANNKPTRRDNNNLDTSLSLGSDVQVSYCHNKRRSWSLREANSEPDALAKINRGVHLVSARSADNQDQTLANEQSRLGLVKSNDRQLIASGGSSRDYNDETMACGKCTPNRRAPTSLAMSYDVESTKSEVFCNKLQGRFEASANKRLPVDDKGAQGQVTDGDLAWVDPLSADYVDSSTISNRRHESTIRTGSQSVGSDNNYGDSDESEADRMFAEYGNESEPSRESTAPTYERSTNKQKEEFTIVVADSPSNDQTTSTADEDEKIIRAAKLRLINKLFNSTGDNVSLCLAPTALDESLQNGTNELEELEDNLEGYTTRQHRWSLERLRDSGAAVAKNRSLRHSMLLNNHLISNLSFREHSRDGDHVQRFSKQTSTGSFGSPLEKTHTCLEGNSIHKGRRKLPRSNGGNNRSWFSASDPSTPMTSRGRNRLAGNSSKTNGHRIVSAGDELNRDVDSMETQTLLSKHTADILTNSLPACEHLVIPKAVHRGNSSEKFGGPLVRDVGLGCRPNLGFNGAPEVGAHIIISGSSGSKPRGVSINEVCPGAGPELESNHQHSLGHREAMDRKDVNTVYSNDKRGS